MGYEAGQAIFSKIGPMGMISYSTYTPLMLDSQLYIFFSSHAKPNAASPLSSITHFNPFDISLLSYQTTHKFMAKSLLNRKLTRSLPPKPIPYSLLQIPSMVWIFRFLLHRYLFKFSSLVRFLNLCFISCF